MQYTITAVRHLIRGAAAAAAVGVSLASWMEVGTPFFRNAAAAAAAAVYLASWMEVGAPFFVLQQQQQQRR